jgi:hypothetical protein
MLESRSSNVTVTKLNKSAKSNAAFFLSKCLAVWSGQETDSAILNLFYLNSTKHQNLEKVQN